MLVPASDPTTRQLPSTSACWCLCSSLDIFSSKNYASQRGTAAGQNFNLQTRQCAIGSHENIKNLVNTAALALYCKQKRCVNGRENNETGVPGKRRQSNVHVIRVGRLPSQDPTHQIQISLFNLQIALGTRFRPQQAI
jgi:hypothetical protein